MAAIPQKFDWVAKRAACTVATVFNELRDAIENEDVPAINSARGISGSLEAFEAKMVRADCIAVSQPNLISRNRTSISISDDRIVVAQDRNGTNQWSATVGLNDEGRAL